MELHLMKQVIIICLTLMVIGRSYSQDSVSQSTLKEIVKEFSEGSRHFTSYKRLPKFVRKYLDEKEEGKFRIARIFFNATDIGWGFSRKLYYVEKKGGNYILSYEHGGSGNHFHSIIFETNGSRIINVYNLITIRHRRLNELQELIERRMYKIYDVEV